MGARKTYALTCDGDGCEQVFFPPARVERHEGNVSRVEFMVVPQLASAVRTQALRAGWSNVFHEPPKGQSGPGWYVDKCPACTGELKRCTCRSSTVNASVWREHEQGCALRG